MVSKEGQNTHGRENEKEDRGHYGEDALLEQYGKVKVAAQLRAKHVVAAAHGEYRRNRPPTKIISVLFRTTNAARSSGKGQDHDT